MPDGEEADPRLVRLGPDDNVLLLTTTVPAGATVRLGGRSVVPGPGLSLGHKLAARDIAAGETIVKYGAPIGVATEAIPMGTHVHVHNVRSAYTPTYVLADADAEEASS